MLGSAALSVSGAAPLTIDTLTPGTHTLMASFQAAGGYAGSSSSPVEETVLPGIFGITLSPATITLHSGQQGTVQITLTSIGGFSGALTLSSGAIPAYASSTFSPAMVTLAAGGSGSANLLLNTATARLEPWTGYAPKRSSAVLAVVVMLLLPLRSTWRERLKNVLGTLLLAALLVGVSGCGFIGSPFHTAAPGIYQVPITAVDGNHHSQTALLQMTVTP